MLQLVDGGHPLPLGYWRAFRGTARRLFRPQNPQDLLLPSWASLQSTGASVRTVELQNLLSSDVTGDWSLDNATIDFLWRWLRRARPRVILECGAGISTIILAAYAATQRAAGQESPRVFSIEQEGRIKEETEARLARCGWSDYVHIFHAPLNGQDRYQVDETALEQQVGDDKAEALLIDGPYGMAGCRIWTLPLLARFCRTGARWFLDDAFRDAEMGILQAWARLPGAKVEGIHPIGKGLGTGLITFPQSVRRP